MVVRQHLLAARSLRMLVMQQDLWVANWLALVVGLFLQVVEWSA